MRSIRKQLTAVLVGAAAVSGLLLPATTAVAAPAATGSVSAGAAKGVKVEAINTTIKLTTQLNRIITNAVDRHDNREGYVRSIVLGAFYEAGQRYNVLVIKFRHQYTFSVHDLVYDAKVSADGYPAYRVIVFSSGQVVNNSDGGADNWGFKGWFTRDGGRVTFRQP
ncbi:hypothetical protein [Crossiella sp. NPDC003009]